MKMEAPRANHVQKGHISTLIWEKLHGRAGFAFRLDEWKGVRILGGKRTLRLGETARAIYKKNEYLQGFMRAI